MSSEYINGLLDFSVYYEDFVRFAIQRRSMSSKGARTIAAGSGGTSVVPVPDVSSGGGGGALVSPRFLLLCWSNHLSISSARLVNGRLPRRSIMSSLKNRA